jgi:hypothetical protein
VTIDDDLRRDGYSLVCGDNLEVLSLIHAELLAQWSPSLVYMDPPFNTGIVQKGWIGFGGMDRLSYNDPTCDLMTFADDLTLRVKEAWRMLPMQGNLVVHLDWRTVHYAKVHLDQVLGVSSFASEIIWMYRRWPTKTRNFQRVHDTLLRYIRDSEQATWNQLYVPPSESTLKTWGTKKQRAIMRDGKRARRQGDYGEMINGQIPTWFAVKWIGEHRRHGARLFYPYDELRFDAKHQAFCAANDRLPNRDNWTLVNENGEPISDAELNP